VSDRYPQVEVTSRDEWRAWLAANHDSLLGVWLVTFKRAADPERYVSYDAVVEEALCFGWIDSRARGVDASRSSLLVTPRRAGSGWSRSNKERTERLEAAGLIETAGLAVIDTARADGSWSALDDIENLVEPPELRAALDAEPAARRHWDAFPRSARRATLAWIAAAKRPETRARRLAETARLAAENVRANQPPPAAPP
jgi:uncharacterized protein YdeI (YjbR/CyaY-like superfamily)